MTGGVVSITTGASHTCAATAAGSVACWGAGPFGQLGGGLPQARVLVPVEVRGESGVTAVVAGGEHTCSTNASGKLDCWGRNGSGQLGDDSTNDSHVPQAVAGWPSDALAAGRAHSCHTAGRGTVLCWGDNGSGQLGDGSTTERHVPTVVPGLEFSVGAIAAGASHSCGVTWAGEVMCWGSNEWGQLGQGSTLGSSVPTHVVGVTLTRGAFTIAAGSGHTCAVTPEGAVLCWGRNQKGQLGDGSRYGSLSPVAVSGLPAGIVSVAAGGDCACAVAASGEIACWGDNDAGQLGDGSTTDSASPVRPVGL